MFTDEYIEGLKKRGNTHPFNMCEFSFTRDEVGVVLKTYLCKRNSVRYLRIQTPKGIGWLGEVWVYECRGDEIMVNQEEIEKDPSLMSEDEIREEIDGYYEILNVFEKLRNAKMKLGTYLDGVFLGKIEKLREELERKKK